jgi:FkbM family methyltransferase
MKYVEHVVTLAGIKYCVWDTEGSIAVDIIETELAYDRYHLEQLDIHQGNIIIDVGGHIGLFAIYAATRWPGVAIHAFEPFPPNSYLFDRNVAASGLQGIHLHRHAIAGCNKIITMTGSRHNSGGATSFSKKTDQVVENVTAITLDEVFAKEKIEICSLLKLDCEGAEYDILCSTAVLGRVKYLRGELHTNKALVQMGCDPRQIVRRCLLTLSKNQIRFNICRIDE